MSGARAGRAAPTNRRSRSNVSASIGPPPPRLLIPDEPPKVPRRPPSKGNKRETLADIAKRIPIQLMRKYFNYPLRSAAEAMFISVTTLKRLCRRHGVKRWPHRQISGINRALSDLEAQHEIGDGEGEEIDESVAEQLRQLHRRREIIIELAFESDDEDASQPDTEEPPPVAHKKRGHRKNSASTDSTSSSTSTASSGTSSSSSRRSRTDSVTSTPESPCSATSLDESAPTSVWWQHTPVVVEDKQSSASAVVAATSAVTAAPNGGIAKRSTKKSSVGRPRGSGSRGRAPRGQRSSAVFGNISRSGARGGAAATGHRRKSSTVPGAKKERTSSALSESSPSSCSGGASGSRVGGIGTGLPGYLELSAATAVAAAAASRAGGNLFDQHLQLNQQMDDLAMLGELLFGPDETAAAAAAAAAELRDNSGTTGVFAHNASQWAPCVPFCPSEVFSHDHEDVVTGAPTPSAFSSLSANEMGFTSGLASASNWGGLGSDRNGLGLSTSGHCLL